MEIVNKIIGGVHSDNDPNYQPENTMRNSLNGVIMDAGEGNYIWQTIKGTKYSFALEDFLKIMSWCIIRDRFIIIVLDILNNTVGFLELDIDSTGVATQTLLWTGSNTDLNLSLDHPIRAMFGFYESQEIQRIYWTDYYNNPRTLNIGYADPANKLVTIDAKFLPFSPEITQAYGKFKLDAIISGGYLKAGSYFFAWRYNHENYYSDWSYLSNPVNLAPGNAGATPDTYQAFEGAAPDEITNKAIRFDINGLDADYSSIQVAVFYSNDYNSAEPGVIFYDGDLTGTDMTFLYLGNENAGILTMDELIEVSVVIERCKDMTPIKKRNTIAHVKLRDELDFSGANTESKNNMVDCEMTLAARDIILDVTGYPTTIPWAAGEKGLFQSPLGAYVKLTSTTMYSGIQYQGVGTGGANYTGAGGGAITWVNDEIFSLPTGADTGTLTSGVCEPVIALKKYKKASASGTPIWSDYEWDVTSLIGEFLDFKSPVVSNLIRSNPSGETIRYGLLCFDLTGRPFYVRWLKNKDVTLGLGDPVMGKRSAIPLTSGYDLQTPADGDYYNQLNGKSIGVNFSNIDLTDVIDQISGFMIVRAPIVHQYIGSGLIGFTYETVFGSGSKIYSNPGWRAAISDASRYDGTYTFYSPEDIFGLKGFSIQPGDNLEAMRYYIPYRASQTATAGFQGFGAHEVSYVTSPDNQINLYQKFCIESGSIPAGAGANAAINLEHEILYSTKYNLGDPETVFDPRNELLSYQPYSFPLTSGQNFGQNAKHNVLVLDIDESGNNPKGKDNLAITTPYALHCSIKRDIVSPYGGTSDSSLANTLYLAIGHFQEINATVKADIESGGKYIFNDIEVFGGDHYIGLFDTKRVMVDEDVSTTDRFGQGVIFPVESRVNVALRGGNHHAKERTYHSTENTIGLRYALGNMKLPEYNYNDGYSSDDIQDYYLPIPYNTTLLSDFDDDIRWSPQKSSGERRDQFRVFRTNDKLTVESSYGALTNIKAKFSRLIYWQTDAVGYIPINERALTQGAFGDPVQLGVGGIFERYDEMTDKIGNSNQFGLVESDMGFHWYDAKRRMFITLTEALKFSQDSVAKGLNNWLEENVLASIADYDNPMLTAGTSGGYDPYHKVVFYAFHNPSFPSKAIGYDVRLQKYIGEFQMLGGMWFRRDEFLFSIKTGTAPIHVHGEGDYGRIYEANADPEITIVLKDAEHAENFFDSFKIIGNENFFDEITITNSDQTVTEVIQSNASGQYRFVGRNYKYRNRRWYGNFPKELKERFVDGYLIVTFRGHPQLIKFLEMRTKVHKAY